MTTTEEEQTRALEDSAMACIADGRDFWWIDAHWDGATAHWYAQLIRRDDPTPFPVPLERVECADYDAMVAECVRRNRAAREEARA